jgi:RNA polymerase sigma-70 factor (ECF subfamily)
MDHLSPQQRMVFTLKHYEGYKLAEIASMMECAEGTVKRYLFTATEKLRQRLARLY